MLNSLEFAPVNPRSLHEQIDYDFLAGGGEMGRHIRAHDWASTPLGPPARWPQSLRTAIRLLLTTNHPVFLWWGQELSCFYNDAYSRSIGPERHPGILGQSGRAVWSEIWDIIGPQIEMVMAGHGATWHEDQLVPITRHGRREDVYWTYGYSPIADDAAPHGVGGVLVLCTETTESVLAKRRLAFLLELENEMRPMTDAADIMAAAAGAIGRHLKAGRAGYGEIDRAQKYFTTARDWTNGRMPSIAGRHRLNNSGAYMLEEFGAGRTIQVEDAEADPRPAVKAIARAYSNVGLRAALATPLMKGDHLVAFLYVHDQAPRRWTHDDVTLVREVAERTWSAVARARAETERGRARDAERDALRMITQGVPIVTVLENLIRALEVAVEAELYGCAMFVDRDGKHLRSGAAPSLPAEYVKALDGLAVGPNAGSCGTAVYRGEPVFVADIASDPLWSDFRDLALRQGLRACWSTPIRAADGRILGTFAVYYGEPRQPSWREMDLVNHTVHTAALAIERHLADQALRESEKKLATDLAGMKLLRKISSRLVRIEDLQSLAQEILQAAMEITRSDKGLLRLRDAATGTLPIIAHFGLPQSYIEEFPAIRDDQGIWAEAKEAGRVVICEDVTLDPILSRKPYADLVRAAGVGAGQATPLISREGVLVGVLSTFFPAPHRPPDHEMRLLDLLARQATDMIERVRIEGELRESEDHYRHAVDLHPQVAWTALPNGKIEQIAARWQEWTGVSDLDQPIVGVVHADDRRATRDAWRVALANATAYDVEHRVRMRDGNHRWMRSRAYPRRRADGHIVKWYGTTEDIHDRKIAQMHQQLLIQELGHRSKNTLAVVLAMAKQSFRNAASIEDAQETFTARLFALSRAQDLLTNENWRGGDLGTLVRTAIEHLAAARGRFVIQGPPVWLEARPGLAISLAMHELSTNAVKYGALSRETGAVAVTWSIAAQDGGQRLVLRWRESGGPPVTAPTETGFGSRLIEDSLAHELGGEARIDYAPEGIVFTLSADLARIAPPGPQD